MHSRVWAAARMRCMGVRAPCAEARRGPRPAARRATGRARGAARAPQGSCGGTHTLVLTAEGRIFTWGRGSFGRLGTGVEKDCHAPVEVFLPGAPQRLGFASEALARRGAGAARWQALTRRGGGAALSAGADAARRRRCPAAMHAGVGIGFCSGAP